MFDFDEKLQQDEETQENKSVETRLMGDEDHVLILRGFKHIVTGKNSQCDRWPFSEMKWPRVGIQPPFPVPCY